MEILNLLDALEDLFEQSTSIPFSKKVLVDSSEGLDLIKEIQLKLPDEIKQAKWVKEERQRIIMEAQKEAEEIIKEAENRIIAMIDEHEITRKAYEKKTEIIDVANSKAREMTEGTISYIDDKLAAVENLLQEELEIIRANRKELK